MSSGGLLSPALRATTVGALALVSLHAFEALALTTVMPTIARDLHGESLYAMAFTATLAAGIVSIVWSGNLADRRGPRPPLVLGLALFALGLIGAGLAATMPVLVGARVVQGLGAGMTSTGIVGARPAPMRPRAKRTRPSTRGGRGPRRSARLPDQTMLTMPAASVAVNAIA